MTEGPEATFLATYILRRFKQKRLRSISIRGGRYKTHGSPVGFRAFTKGLPLKLLDVVKKGKVLFFLFESGWTLVAKLGMTGWFATPFDEPLFDSEPNLVFHFEHQDLEFFDFRNFGTLQFTQDRGVVLAEMERIAPDILQSDLAKLYLRIQSLNLSETKPSLRLDEALLDQTLLFSGIRTLV